MPLKIIDNGTDNVVLIHPDHLELGEGTVTVTGSGNRISIARPYVCGRIEISIAGGASVTIGPDCVISTVHVVALGGSVSIGARVNFNGPSVFRADEGRSVSVGDDCLFAEEVRVWTSDMHSIVDVKTRRRVNPARDVRIGNRVWVGDRALVLKGASVGDGSIVGASAVLSGHVPENCIAVGNRAKVVRRGVSWDKSLQPMLPSAPKIARKERLKTAAIFAIAFAAWCVIGGGAFWFMSGFASLP